MIKTFQIGNNKIPFELTLGARRNFEIETGTTLNKFSEACENNELHVDHWMCLLWVGLRAGSRKNGSHFNMTYPQFIAWLEDEGYSEETIVYETVSFLGLVNDTTAAAAKKP